MTPPGRGNGAPAIAVGGSWRRLQPLPPSDWAFPDASKAPPYGYVAEGGDFAPPTVVAAYRAGCFPWPRRPGDEELWFSPDPRAVIVPGTVHVSRRLARTIRSARFRVTVDQDFAGVIAACAVRPEDDGTWITPNLAAAYRLLHHLGWTHSVEVWTLDGDLAGGLYGLQVGRLFGAESMFHRVTDASKVALAALDQVAQREGIALIDVQLLTPHLASMGALEIPRAEYLRLMRELTAG